MKLGTPRGWESHMTVTELINYLLLRGKDTRELAYDLAWVYESRQAAAERRVRR
jgi:hypothetical protein